MCRLLVYYGDPILLASSVLWPERSIIKQSYDARERLLDPTLPAHLGHGNLNADGFGIGWYSADEHCPRVSKNGTAQRDDTPCTFKAITPAWNNDNLMKLASKIRSRLMFAHVRAAYPGMPVSEQNCHPFTSGRYMFMHNGIIAGFSKIRRKLLEGLSEAAYDSVQSFHSDSAVSFALFLSFLPDMEAQQPPDVILIALQRALQLIGEKQAEAGLADCSEYTSLLNFAVTDGATLIVTCCVSPDDEKPASLYYAEGTTFRRSDGLALDGDAPYSIDYANKSARVVMVASEPITGSASEWVAVPRNHGLVVTRDADGDMSVLHVPMALAPPGPRMDTVVRCLRTLPLEGATPSESQSLLTKHMRRMSRLCGPVQRSSMCMHCGRTIQGESRARSPSTASGTPPRATPLAAAAGRAASHRGRPPGRSNPLDLPVRHGGPAPGLDSMNLATSPVLPGPLLEAREEEGSGGGSPRERHVFTSGADAHLLTGHQGAILNLVHDCDGLLYSSSSDKTVKVWDLSTLECTNTWAGHTKAILKLQMQGKYIFSIGGPSIRVWNKATGTCVHRILTPRRAGWVRAISVSPDLDIVAGCQDTTLRRYRFAPDAPSPPPLGLQSMPSCPRGPPARRGEVVCARSTSDAHAPPATLIAPVGAEPGAGGSKARATFDVSPEGACVTEAVLEGRLDDGHCAAIHAVVSSRRFVCSAGGDSTIRVWRATSLEPVTTMTGHRGPVFALLMLGDLLLSGGRDATIRVWDLDTCCCRRTLPGHTADVLNMSALAPGLSWNGNATDCCPTDRGSVDADSDGDGAVGEAIAGRADRIPAHGGALLLASCSADGSCRLWDVQTWTCVHAIVPGTGKEVEPVLCCAITETHLALGLPSGALHVYGIGGILDSMAALQARTVHTLTKTWRTPSSELLVEASDSLGSDGTDAAGAAAAPGSKDLQVQRSVTWRRPFQVKENAQARVEQQLLASLSHFVGLRTVSGDPHLHEDVFAGAKYLAGLLESVGMQVKLAQNVNTVHPCVLARLEVCPQLPTVVFYGHYDVFYVDDDNWVTNPFHMTSKDGYLYGRGTSDNKGPILAMVFAVKELLDRREGEACAGLPCNLSFVFEGEEEIGSPGLATVVESHPSWFTDARLIVISNSQWIGDELPCLTLGMRGMLCMTVRVDGGTRDLHSGNDGGVFNEPMGDLVRVMASLVDSQHNILVPGFYDGVDPHLLEPILEAIQEGGGQDFSVEAYAASLGVPVLTCGSTLREVLTARWCLPSMTIADVRSSTTDESSRRFGPTRFSVVPHYVTGHISIRYVPNQCSEELISHLTRHMHHEFRKLRSANTLSVSVRSRGQCWSAAPDSACFRDAAVAIEAEWGRKPLPVREGGTMPCASMLESLLGAPAIMIPMGQNSDNCHLANERLRRVNLIKGKNVIRRIIEGFRPGA